MDPMFLAAVYLVNKKRRYWIHPINEERDNLGEYHRLVQELRLDSQRFNTYCRMSPEIFEKLLQKVGPRIQKQHTKFRQALCSSQKLMITLR
jgi:hypothetical protein